ncbi:MAG: hypothetical protein H8E75_00495 [Puniceicoccaceae bacterium]|nr:hypothetical protein [Puniceicoccaceae bacterium]
MSTPHNEQELGKSLRSKKKRSAVFIVIAVSIVVHVLALGGLAAIKIIEVLQPEPEFEAPPVVATKPPPPPPPPPPTTKLAQRSMPRPQPLAVKNAQNTSVPAIEINNANLTVGGGRGFGGGLGALGGAVADSIRISSFGFDQAMEGTLEGTLYDFKQDTKKKSLLKDSTDKGTYASGILKSFTDNFRRDALDRKFFKPETLLYGAYFVIPNTSASAAPRAFKAEGVIAPELICAAYTGTYRPTKSGRFRLFGKGDDALIVRINGKTVLDGSWTKSAYSRWNQPASAKRADEKSPQSYFGFSQPGVTGDWFELRAGRETQVEVVIAEVPGSMFGAYLLIEEEGVPGKQIFTTRPLGDKDKTFLRNSHPDAAQFIK